LEHEKLVTNSASAIFTASSITTRSHYTAWGKRALDLALSFIILPFVAPVILILLVLTRMDGAPGIFGHLRVGKNGAKFRCLKIRTMVPGAEEKLSAYLQSHPAAAEEWAQTQKLTNDPRVTPIGRFLRKTSLDELPQFWNVIKGEMSFVGPRPVTDQELDRYGPNKQSYLSMKPGITGVWQVSGRSDGSYTQRCQMDRDYATRIGLLLDLSLIARTALVFVRPTGR